jgi:hypothetical protein
LDLIKASNEAGAAGINVMDELQVRVVESFVLRVECTGEVRVLVGGGVRCVFEAGAAGINVMDELQVSVPSLGNRKAMCCGSARKAVCCRRGWGVLWEGLHAAKLS